jgi:hypothetical protein
MRLLRSGPAKTLNQVKAHFGLAVMMIRQQMIDLGWAICGVAPSKDMIHEILIKCCGGVGPLGQTVRLSEQTIDENMKFFENIRDWAATELHLVIPDPDPNYRRGRCENPSSQKGLNSTGPILRKEITHD